MGLKMNCWESLFTHTYHQQGVSIEEQKENDFNPIYALANVTGGTKTITHNSVSIPSSVPIKSSHRKLYTQGNSVT